MRRKDVPFHRGEGGNIYRYAYIIVYKLNQGSRRRNDILFHRGGRGGGKHVAAREGRTSRSTGGGGGKTYIAIPIYTCI